MEQSEPSPYSARDYFYISIGSIVAFTVLLAIVVTTAVFHENNVIRKARRKTKRSIRKPRGHNNPVGPQEQGSGQEKYRDETRNSQETSSRRYEEVTLSIPQLTLNSVYDTAEQANRQPQPTELEAEPKKSRNTADQKMVEEYEFATYSGQKHIYQNIDNISTKSGAHCVSDQSIEEVTSGKGDANLKMKQNVETNNTPLKESSDIPFIDDNSEAEGDNSKERVQNNGIPEASLLGSGNRDDLKTTHAVVENDCNNDEQHLKADNEGEAKDKAKSKICINVSKSQSMNENDVQGKEEQSTITEAQHSIATLKLMFEEGKNGKE